MPKSLKKRSLHISNSRDNQHATATPPPDISSRGPDPSPIYIKLRHEWSRRTTLLVFLAFTIIRIMQSLPFGEILRRLLPALFHAHVPYASPIGDCDETFNYWEPTHLLLTHSASLQTWEYSPVYALRSYLYVFLHAAVGLISRTVIFQTIVPICSTLGGAQTFLTSPGIHKIVIFYCIRAALALFCTFGEIVFLYGIASRFGRRIALYTSFFLLFSAGMGLGGAFAYLPGGFSMVGIMVAFGAWFYEVGRVQNVTDKKSHSDAYASMNALKWMICICAAGTAVILGWPFSVVCVIPLALDTIYHTGFMPSLKIAVVISAFLITLSMAFDNIYYERWFFTQWNLVNYNKGEGSEKYGTEPWNYYVKNLLLNFNGAFVLSLLAPVVILLRGIVASSITYYSPVRLLIYLIPYYVWFVFFSSLPHKEERFMVVVYPMICLAAAMCLEYSFQLVDYFSQNSTATSQSNPSARTTPRTNKNIILVTPPRRSLISWIIIALILLAYIAISISRFYSITYNYSAPFKVYTELAQHIERTRREPDQVINVCVGKEWYRFPSSFFLPGKNTRLRFLRSDFRGLLPKYFADWPYSTSSVPTNMNDDNREEMDRYVDESQCHYVVDLDLPQQHEKHYCADENNWHVISEMHFLDAEKSPQMARAFWIPLGYSERRNVYGRYYVAERVR